MHIVDTRTTLIRHDIPMAIIETTKLVTYDFL